MPESQGFTATALPWTEQLGISSEVITVVEFGFMGCILIILVIAVPVIVTTRRHSRRQK
jgi:hypothetical protein